MLQLLILGYNLYIDIQNTKCYVKIVLSSLIYLGEKEVKIQKMKEFQNLLFYWKVEHCGKAVDGLYLTIVNSSLGFCGTVG